MIQYIYAFKIQKNKLVSLSEKLGYNLCLHTKTFMGGDDKVVISK